MWSRASAVTGAGKPIPQFVKFKAPTSLGSIDLTLLPVSSYVGVNRDDPIRFYTVPGLGWFYRRRVEMCLEELTGGQRVLEIGFGSGVSFFSLHDLYAEIHGIDLTAGIDEAAGFFRGRGIETQLQQGDVRRMASSTAC